MIGKRVVRCSKLRGRSRGLGKGQGGAQVLVDYGESEALLDWGSGATEGDAGLELKRSSQGSASASRGDGTCGPVDLV